MGRVNSDDQQSSGILVAPATGALEGRDVLRQRLEPGGALENNRGIG